MDTGAARTAAQPNTDHAAHSPQPIALHTTAPVSDCCDCGSARLQLIIWASWQPILHSITPPSPHPPPLPVWRSPASACAAGRSDACTLHSPSSPPSPLLLTALTGVAYRVSRNVLGYEKPSVSWLMSVHTLSFLSLHALYPVLLALLTLALMATAFPLGPVAASLTSLLSSLLSLLSSSSSSSRISTPRTPLTPSSPTSPTSPTSLSPSPSSSSSSSSSSPLLTLPRLTPRLLHRYLTLLLFPPLLATTLTGLLYTLSRHYLHHPRETYHPLLAIHQGDYTSSPVAYTTGLALLVVAGVVPGVMLMGWWRKWVGGRGVGGGGGGGGVGGVGGGVRYTMLAVKHAFEREDDDEEEVMGGPSGRSGDGDGLHASDESESMSS